ncbi:MAG: SMR family transporter [Syntrophales bacterium]|jgi:drug/metabolite transporter (DMT)-like permease
MNTQALFLVISAALLHAVWNLIFKKTNGRLPFIWLVSLASAVIYFPFVIWQLAQRQAVLTSVTYGFALASAVLHLLYFIVLQVGYRKADLSVVYPMARGTGPLLSAMGAILFFGERPSWMAVSGIVLIVTGVLIMTGLRLSLSDDERLKTGIVHGTITGLFIAAYTLWDKMAVTDYNVSALILTFASTLLPLLVLLPKAVKEKQEIRREIRQHWKHGVAIALLAPLSFILVLMALKTAPVSYVAPARELSIVFGVFFGTGLLKEADAKSRFIAAIIMLLGISFLAIG